MKRAQLIGVSVAGVSAILAFVVMKGFVKAPEPQKGPVIEQTVNATEVLVARTEIALGQITSESQFRWQKWPQEAVTSGFITKTSGGVNAMRELAGAIARAPIMAGEPITVNKLIKAGQGGVLAAILPAGMRGVSTKIDAKTSAGGLVLPNDHVDVILIRRLRGRGGTEEHVADTLFRNVRVLAIGQQIETKEGKKTADSAASSTTATLELTPRQAELLALANAMGEISLSLRSVADLALESGPTNNELQKQRSNAVRVLRYGIKSRAYGVN
jgi:pilus assembly protein CpaB